MSRHAPALALLAVTALWGWTFVVVADAVAVYGVLAFLALRFTLAATVLAAGWGRRLDRRTMVAGAGIGAFLAAGYLLQTFGLRLTSPTNAGLITGLFVVIAPVADHLLYRTSMRRSAWAAVALSVAGMALLAGGTSLRPASGDLLILACALAFGLHIAVLSRHAARFDAGALTLAQMATLAVVFAIGWAALEPLRPPTPPVWGAVVITGLLASAAAYAIQTWAQQHLSAARTALILTAEPVFAAMFGYLLAGDRLSAVQILGGAMIVAALVMAEAVPSLIRESLER